MQDTMVKIVSIMYMMMIRNMPKTLTESIHCSIFGEAPSSNKRVAIGENALDTAI
jgi:hypothetical protein